MRQLMLNNHRIEMQFFVENRPCHCTKTVTGHVFLRVISKTTQRSIYRIL